MEAGVRQDEAKIVGQGRFGENQGNIAPLKHPGEGGRIIKRDNTGLLGDVGRQAALLGDKIAVDPDLHQGLVKMPVVLAVKKQHLVAPGGRPGNADDFGIGLAGREGVLPLGQPVTAAQFL